MINENNRVVKILMNRDNISADEAIKRVKDCSSEISEYMAAIDNPLCVDSIIEDMLGLEGDYLFDILDWM